MRSKWTDSDTLRDRAERRIGSGAFVLHPPEGTDQLHELLVYQAELEMQNEALRDAHDELAQSESRYRSLFENAPVAYLVLDSSSRVLSANPQARELLGAALVGSRLARYLLPEKTTSFERFRREVLASEERLVAEFTLVDQKAVHREIRVEALRTGDSEWRAALIDMSAQNIVLRRLSHSERLGAVGAHASGIAHDLNNLLFSVSGHADVALRFLDGAHASYQPLLQLRRVVERCVNATKQLANFARAEAAPASLVDLNPTIAQAKALLTSLLGADIDLELELDATDAVIRMDAPHVEQILITAIRNARQAMPHGGTFRIETSNLTTERARDGETALARYIRWTMSDTGMGMTESTRRRAFDPFFTTKPAGMGTGLGLSLVKSVVERAGGSALLESDVGRGTSLVIHLPCASASSVSSRPAPPPRPSATTVMLVERTPEIRLRLSLRLRDAGCDVLEPADSAEALEQLKKTNDRVAVLLIDEGLPGAVEGEFLAAVRLIAPFVEVVVISFVNADDSRPDDATIDSVTDRVLTAVSRLNQ